MTSLFFARETAVLMTFSPMDVKLLVKRRGTSLVSSLQSAMLITTVSHSLPWEPCIVITLSLYLRGTQDLSNEHWTEYGERTQTSLGSGDSAFR